MGPGRNGILTIRCREKQDFTIFERLTVKDNLTSHALAVQAIAAGTAGQCDRRQ
jgi:hypothetical protein